MASKPTCEQGQQQPPMGKSRGAPTAKRHRGTIELENARLKEDTTNKTPVQEPRNPHGQGQDTETPRISQQIATVNIGSVRGDNHGRNRHRNNTGITGE